MASTALAGMPSARAKTLVLPPGTTASSGRSGPHAFAQDAVDDLVDRPVAAERHYDVGTGLDRLGPELDGVATALGLEGVDAKVGAERGSQNVTRAKCRRGGVAD